jgi:hypothetical protein
MQNDLCHYDQVRFFFLLLLLLSDIHGAQYRRLQLPFHLVMRLKTVRTKEKERLSRLILFFNVEYSSIKIERTILAMIE